MQMRESLFQEKGFPKIDTTQQHFLSKLFEEYPYFSEVPLFTGLSVCLLDNLKILAKENIKIAVREVSEHFCRLHIGLQMYVDAKKDVEKRLFSGQPVAKFCLEALKSSNLSVTPSFFCDALNQMRQDLLKTKETPTKKKVCLIIDVLDLLVKTPGFQEVFYYIELKSYKEMTHQITSIADLLPLISCHARILKVLHDHVTSSDYLDLHRKPLELFEKAIEHLIRNDKDQSQSHFLYKKMFKGFVDHSLITAPYHNRFLQYKYDVLHNEPFEVKHIVNAYSQESSFSSFIYIVEKVGHALGLYHNNKAYHILSRVSAMLVHYYGASCMEYEYEFTPPLYRA
jgi:hypothetical protein